MNRGEVCALCGRRHENTTVCDDCACAVAVAADIDMDRDDGAADRLRDVLHATGCEVAVSRIAEVRERFGEAMPDAAMVPWARDFETTEEAAT